MISKTALVSQQQKLPYSGFSHIREWACHAPAKRSIKCLDLDAEQIGVILLELLQIVDERGCTAPLVYNRSSSMRED